MPSLGRQRQRKRIPRRNILKHDGCTYLRRYRQGVGGIRAADVACVLKDATVVLGALLLCMIGVGGPISAGLVGGFQRSRKKCTVCVPLIAYCTIITTT
jgi:hypothetical protein